MINHFFRKRKAVLLQRGFMQWPKNYSRLESKGCNNRGAAWRASFKRLSPLMSRIANYQKLSKFNLSMLNVFAVLSIYMFCGGSELSPGKAITLGIFSLSSAVSCSAANQILERKEDGKMYRTKGRPLPRGKISLGLARIYTLGTLLVGVGGLWIFNSSLTAGLSLLTFVGYTAIYTPLKKRHRYSVYVGAVVGALPPLMGCAEAMGTIYSWEALLIFLHMYVWQIAHYMPIAWRHFNDYYNNDFKIASPPKGMPRESLVSTGALHSVFLAAFPLAFCATGLTELAFLYTGSACNLLLWVPFYYFWVELSQMCHKRVLLGGFQCLVASYTLMLFFRKNGNSSTAPAPRKDGVKVEDFDLNVLVGEMN